MTPAAVIFDFHAGLGSSAAIRTQYLFESAERAAEVIRQARDAITAYHGRANDRERLLSFAHLSGEAAIDVSMVVAVSSDDPLGPAQAAIEEWSRGVEEMKARAQAAGKAVLKASEAAHDRDSGGDGLSGSGPSGLPSAGRKASPKGEGQ